MASTTTVIYGLTDPDDGSVRYVGKTMMTLRFRRSGHLTCARQGRCAPVYVWLRKLLAEKRAPGIVLLEVLPIDASWQDAERRVIAEYRESGARLLNVTVGGNGAHERDGLPDHLVPLLGVISDGRIADMAGLTRKAVAYHRDRLGIAASRDRSRARCTFVKGQAAHNRLDRLPAELQSMLGKDPDEQIAKMAGVSRPTVRRIRRELGIMPAPRPRGVDHHGARLTAADVAMIRAEYVQNSREHGGAAIASRLGVATSVIARAVHGLRRKDAA